MISTLETAKEIVDCAELIEIRLIEFSADQIEEDKDSVGIRFSLAELAGELAITFEFRYVSDGYVIATKHLTVWKFQKTCQLKAEALAEFIERVAFMVAYPYIRQSISDFAQKLSLPAPTLGLIKDGQIDLNIDLKKLTQSIEKMTLGKE